MHFMHLNFLQKILDSTVQEQLIQAVLRINNELTSVPSKDDSNAVKLTSVPNKDDSNAANVPQNTGTELTANKAILDDMCHKNNVSYKAEN